MEIFRNLGKSATQMMIFLPRHKKLWGRKITSAIKNMIMVFESKFTILPLRHSYAIILILFSPIESLPKPWESVEVMTRCQRLENNMKERHRLFPLKKPL